MSYKIILVFIFLIAIQFVAGFLFPVYGTNECWKSFDTLNSYKGYSLDSFDKGLLGKVYPLVSDYHINCDAAGFVVLAHDFPNDYFRDRTLFINRPVLPFLVHAIASPLHLVSDSYSMTFIAAIFANFLLFLAAVLLFYALVKKFLSEKAAFLSSFLLIFSPFARGWLIQPETGVFGVFALILSLFLLRRYADFPFSKRLIFYSLAIGILILGKMNLGISLFFVICAIIFKRYKEGAIFFALHLVPFALWYLLVTGVWGLSFGMQEVSNFGAGIWIIDMINWPLYEIIGELISVFPNFLTSIFYAFLFLPVAFSILGFYFWNYKNKSVIYLGLAAAFLMFFFTLHLYLPRHAFWMFPAIYPMAVFGIDKLLDFLKNKGLRKFQIIYYSVVYALIILPSFTNIFLIYEYLGAPYS